MDRPKVIEVYLEDGNLLSRQGIERHEFLKAYGVTRSNYISTRDAAEIANRSIEKMIRSVKA